MSDESRSPSFVQGAAGSPSHLSVSEQLAAAQRRIQQLEQELATRRHAEDVLQVSTAKLRLVLNQLPVMIWTADRQFCITSWAAGSTLAGATGPQNEIVGKTIQEFFRNADPYFPPVYCAQQANEGESTNLTFEWLGRVFLLAVEPYWSRAGAVIGHVAVAVDVTARTRPDDERRGADDRYRELVENASDLICTLDLRGRFTSVNRIAEPITGYPRRELLQKSILEIAAPESAPAIQEILGKLGENPTPVRFEWELLARDGRRVTLDASARPIFREGRPVGLQAIARVAPRRPALTEPAQPAPVLQPEKMEAVATLAGGIAHEFNNILTGIVGYADLLKLWTGSDERATSAVSTIQQGAERAARLTNQLLGFARRGKNQNVPVDIHELIREVIRSLESGPDNAFHYATDFRIDRCEIIGDPVQLREVILALLQNAREAMPSGGQITFRTGIAALAARLTAVDDTLAPGRYLRIAVQDTGVGIPPELHARIFEPFFTTKKGDTHNGMGLSTVYGIVKNHGGFIHVESRPGEGSTFELYFPAPPDAQGGTAGRATIETPDRPKTLMIVDDDPYVRHVLEQMLIGLGYRVFAFDNCRAAVDFYREHPGDVELVIMDLVMPKLGGGSCFAALQAINPEVKAILSSGYAADGAVQEALNLGMKGFLPKPYQLGTLKETISRVLES